MNCKIIIKTGLILLMGVFSMPAIAQTGNRMDEKKKILIHITSEPESPTKVALGLLVAKTAVEEGYGVTLFLAGDSVQFLRNEVLANLTGLGTGKLKDHYDAIVEGVGYFTYLECPETPVGF